MRCPCAARIEVCDRLQQCCAMRRLDPFVFRKGAASCEARKQKGCCLGDAKEKGKKARGSTGRFRKCMGAVLTVVFLYAGSYRHYGLQGHTARLLAESEQFSGPVNRVSCCQLSALSVTAVSPVSSSVSSIKSLTGQASGALPVKH